MADTAALADAIAGTPFEDVDPTGAIPSRGPRRAETKPFAGSTRAADINDALQEYGRVVMRLVQREDLIARAREEIEQARQDVAAAAARLTDLGIPVPTKPKKAPDRRTRSIGGGPATSVKPGELSDLARKILDDLRGAGPGTGGQIAERTGLMPQQVGVTCASLARKGLVERYEDGAELMWRATNQESGASDE